MPQKLALMSAVVGQGYRDAIVPQVLGRDFLVLLCGHSNYRGGLEKGMNQNQGEG